MKCIPLWKVFSVLSLLLTSCSESIDLALFADKKADEIYTMGKRSMAEKKYSAATAAFEELCKLYPYSGYVEFAQIYSGYCSYMMKKYEEAAVAFSVFVKTHPVHINVPYALYMLGIIEYDQILIVERDQDATLNALAYFSELRQRYPESKYANLAKEKLFEIRDHMAGKEVYVALYYQKRNNFAAAINRLNTVIEQFHDTKHVPEALHRLVECYVSIGVLDEAQKANQVLQKKHSKTRWAEHSASLLARLSKGLVQ
jgi:outer membrane protein assembly factor BamD